MYEKLNKLWVRVLVTVGNYILSIVLIPLMIIWTLIKVTKWKICDECDIGYLEASGYVFEGLKEGHTLNMKYLKGELSYVDYMIELGYGYLIVEEDEEEEEA